MKNVLRSIAITMLFAFILGPAFGQGLYWESTVSGLESGAPARVSKGYYMPKMYKESDDATHLQTIIRGDKELILRVDTEKKTYSEITFAELEKTMKNLGSAMNKRMEEMREKMKDMPEAQRKMVEQMMGQAGTAKSTVEVTETGKEKSVSGYPCKEYVMKLNGKDFMSLWATTAVPDYKVMEQDLQKFSQRMAAMNPLHGSSVVEGLAKVKGFPMETDMHGITHTVTKVEERNTPASEFEVPAGYTKVESGLEKQEKAE